MPPIGRPIANLRIFVLGPALDLVPPGASGELCVRGRGLARGYLGRAARTAEKLVPDPFGEAAGQRLYRSGDRVRHLPDGRLQFLGRLDRQVKIRGLRVEPGEVEEVLLRHPAVAEAVVVVPEAANGKNRDPRLVAYVTLARDADSPSSLEPALRAYLRRHVPAAMVPAALVPVPVYPLTPNGKIDRVALTRRAARETVEPRARAYTAPRNRLERLIAASWSCALGTERIGVHDNFFDAGGHSLLLVEVHRKLREELGTDMEMTELFQFPTVDALARHLSRERQLSAPAAPAPPTPRRTGRRDRAAATRRRQARRTPRRGPAG